MTLRTYPLLANSWEASMLALGVGRPHSAVCLHRAQATAAGQRLASVGVPGHPLDLRVMLRLPAAANARLRI